jgi:GTP cyclohydrolase II
LSVRKAKLSGLKTVLYNDVTDVNTDNLSRNVSRAITDLRNGNPILVHTNHRFLAIHAIEELTPQILQGFNELYGERVTIAITGKRALSLGITDGLAHTYVLKNSDQLSFEEVAMIADPTVSSATAIFKKLPISEGSANEQNALKIVKIASLLPAIVMVDLPSPPENIVMVSDENIDSYFEHVAASLKIVSQANVPLFNAENTQVVAFRSALGGKEHMAIIVGNPDFSAPVLVRLHSECFTGDVLGSLRCDCRSQLQGAIEKMDAEQGGVLLYLAQEGRGIGIVNKLRAYALQDSGFDTIEANFQLGFEEDEREYRLAASMLNLLKIQKIKLMTNNPRKMDALIERGILVTERVSHIFPSNPHNIDYLNVKKLKGGHLF